MAGADAGGRLERGKARGRPAPAADARPSAAQLRYLRRGLAESGGKLPLFDRDGAAISPRTIKSCLRQGGAEPWFANPNKPGWLVCRLTARGRAVASGAEADGGP